MKIKNREVVGSPLAIDPVLDRIYRARAVQSKDDIEYHLGKLLPYTAMKGLKEATILLYSVLLVNKQIIVIGDYDVDGATATTVMVAGLRAMGFQRVGYLIPNRMTDGYGLSPKLVDRAKDNGAELVITVDNGIVSYQGVERAKELGIEVLITDHHLAGDTLPEAIIVNPNQPGCGFPSKCIAGVGVAFYVLVALRAYLREKGFFEKGPNLLQFLDLVALGTVADCVKLDFNNRNMISQGLGIMRSGKARPGIKALLSVAKRSPTLLEADDMGFSVAPRLNAAGRLEDMSTGVKCLLAESNQEARQYAIKLDEINQVRREMQQDMVASAMSYIAKLEEDNEIMIVYQPTCHEGIIGLVASMIKEKFHLPSIVLTDEADGEILKGSCRSIPGLNIRDLLVEYDRLYPGGLVKYGGHAMAAGLSLQRSCLDQFKKGMHQLCSARIDTIMKQKLLWVDGSLPPSHRRLDFAKLLLDSGPWGQGFEKPVFYDRYELCEQYIVGTKHLRVVLKSGEQLLQGIWFNIEEGLWPNHQCQMVDVVYHLQVNEFNQKRQLQLMILQMFPEK